MQALSITCSSMVCYRNKNRPIRYCHQTVHKNKDICRKTGDMHKSHGFKITYRKTQIYGSTADLSSRTIFFGFNARKPFVRMQLAVTARSYGTACTDKRYACMTYCFLCTLTRCAQGAGRYRAGNACQCAIIVPRHTTACARRPTRFGLTKKRWHIPVK